MHLLTFSYLYVGPCTLISRVWLTLLLLSGANSLVRRKRGASNENESLPEQWFIQKLDHFQPTDTRKWLQRYWAKNEYHVEGGPAFLYLTGESPGDSSDITRNQSWALNAKKYNALMFTVETRFYGESHPLSDRSLESLRYLTTEQILADYAFFIEAMNEQYQLQNGTKWVVFGCSYAGALTTWLRYKYPHLVYGAVASSATILAKVDFPEYFDVVQNVLMKYNKKCLTEIKAGFEEITKLIKTAKGRARINKVFRTCDPVTNETDIGWLLGEVGYDILSSVQYDYYKDMCDNIMLNTKLGTRLQRLARTNPDPKKCLETNYNQYYKKMLNTSWTASYADFTESSERQWDYQQCTEIGYFSSSTRDDAFYGDTMPASVDYCSDIYGDLFTQEFVDAAIARTNAVFGGLNPDVTRVVSVQGENDPYGPVQLMHTLNPESPVIVIPGVAHCSYEYEAQSDDPPALRHARTDVSSILGQWLTKQE